MADNKFKGGPGGRLVQAQADATSVIRDPRPKGPYIVQYDKIDYTNPFDLDLAVVKGLKKANTLLGGDVERTGYDRESYGDVINRLEQTPGSLQNNIKIAPKIPNIPSPLAGPVNLGINAINFVRPGVNRVAAASGDVVLDPINRIPVGKSAKLGLYMASGISGLPRKVASGMRSLGVAAPWIDRGSDVVQGVKEYMNYSKKPKFQKKEREMTPKQKEFLQKISSYNFGNVK